MRNSAGGLTPGTQNHGDALMSKRLHFAVVEDLGIEQDASKRLFGFGQIAAAPKSFGPS